jgi:hypothetical protein
MHQILWMNIYRVNIHPQAASKSRRSAAAFSIRNARPRRRFRDD